MGQQRAKAPKASVTREPITPLTIQRLVAAVADDMSTRLKVLAGRHSKQEIISVIEPQSRLNLLQIGVIMNNIAAVQFLLSMGASKDVLWDPLDGVENSWDLSYMPDRVFNDFQNFCINLASPNVAQDAFEHSGLSLLHIAALVGHKEMVRFLVEQVGIPVDVRAAVTGATPLMTATTRGCVSESGLEGPPTHVCGIPASHPDASDGTCKPMLPIVQLLLELGADLGAVDNSGACMLATAAEAGTYGMLQDLLVHVPLVLDQCPKHAGHVLYGMVSNWVRTGTVDKRLEVLKLVKEKYTKAGRSQQFWEELAAPIKRRKSAIVDQVLKVLPGNELMVTHALCRVMVGRNSNRYPAMKYLITLGVPFIALRLGQQHYTVTGRCDAGMVMVIVGALSESYGMAYLAQHFHLLFGLWADSFLHPFDPCPNPDRQETFEKCVGFFISTGRIRDQSLWPSRFSPELCEKYDFCALGKPVSPLVLAAVGGAHEAVAGFTIAYLCKHRGDGFSPELLTFLNQADPCGRLPLIEAIARGRAEVAEELVAAGAELFVVDGLGRMPLHELARLIPPAMELWNIVCVPNLRSKDPKTLSAALKLVATDAPNERKVTLAEMIVFKDAWYMLPQLVQLGLDVHWAPDKVRPGKLLLDAVITCSREDTAYLTAFLTGPLLPAALKAVHNEYTAFSLAVTVGSQKWFKPMLDVCRRDGVDPDELLGWHDDSPPDRRSYPALFTALNLGETVVHLVEAGYDLGPFLGYCIHAPLDGLCGKMVDDGAPIVREQFTLLMWAATFGNPVAVKALLQAGMDPNFHPTRRNTWVPTAMSAALNGQPLLRPKRPGVPLDNKLECVLELLRWKAAITL
ncbi:hypothetical protein COCOBI_04-3080 [Coccomyxa sp. Obi]|nr:hypothetical protein COCOBI_04-3080 [Coccomyxa sp. Obi]